MEYSEVVDRLKALSGRSTEDVENLLGYLFYEDDESCELAPIEQDDLVDALTEATAVHFALLDGDTFTALSYQAAEEISLTQRESRTLFVRFIGDDSLTVESAQIAFTPIEGSIQSSLACDVLMGVTVDPEIDNKKIVVLVSFE